MPLAAAAALGLSLLSSPGHSSEPDQQKYIDAPRSIVGPTVADWVEFFGPEHGIVTPSASRSPHDDSPTLVFNITDGQGTTVRFAVNLISNRHMLLEVESVSQDFLTYMGVDELEYDSNGNADLSYCWDNGCNRLRVTNRHPDGYGAVWNFAWD